MIVLHSLFFVILGMVLSKAELLSVDYHGEQFVWVIMIKMLAVFYFLFLFLLCKS